MNKPRMTQEVNRHTNIKKQKHYLGETKDAGYILATPDNLRLVYITQLLKHTHDYLAKVTANVGLIVWCRLRLLLERLQVDNA
jgi:hypothetical protein